MPNITVPLPPGVYRRSTAMESTGRFWDTNLVRWEGGTLRPIGGWLAVPGYTSAAGSPIRAMLSWVDNSGVRWLAAGHDNGSLFAFNFSTGTTYPVLVGSVLGPPGAPDGFGIGDYGEELWGTPRTVASNTLNPVFGDWWSLDTFGQDLMAINSADAFLYRWSPSTPGTVAAKVATAPRGRIVLVTDERHVLVFAADLDPRKIKWSSQENPDDWTPVPENTAGGLTLNTSGYIVAAAACKEGTLVLTDDDCHLIRYTQPPYVYGAFRIGGGCGPVGHHAIGAAGPAVAWMGPQGFWLWDGGLRALDSDVHDFVFSGLNTNTGPRAFACGVAPFSELWWFYPDQSSVDNNRYVFWDFQEQIWGIGQLSRTSGDPVGARHYLMLGASNGKIYAHENGWTDDGATRVGSIFATTGDIMLGEGDSYQHIRKLYYDRVFSNAMNPPTDLQFKFETKRQIGHPPKILGPFKPRRFDVNSQMTYDGIVDVKFSARSLRLRIEPTVDLDWSVGRIRLDIRQGGSR
jgi:hypothetical protein